MALYLVPLDEGRQIVLDKAIVFIGRHPECDVVLRSSRKVSRRHCCIAQVDKRFVLRDLGSLNGVRINGKRIRNESSMQIGDQVAIGDLRYVLQAEQEASAPQQQGSKSRKRSRKRRETRPVQPIDLSQSFPVPISEEGADFPVGPASHETPDAVPLLGEEDSPESDDVVPLEEDADFDEEDFEDSGSQVEMVSD